MINKIRNLWAIMTPKQKGIYVGLMVFVYVSSFVVGAKIGMVIFN